MVFSLSQEQVNNIHQYLVSHYRHAISTVLGICKDDCVRAYSTNHLKENAPYDKKYWIIEGVYLNVQYKLKSIESSCNENTVMLNIIFKYFFSYKDEVVQSLLDEINAANVVHNNAVQSSYNDDHQQEITIETPRVHTSHEKSQHITQRHGASQDSSISSNNPQSTEIPESQLSGEDAHHWCIVM